MDEFLKLIWYPLSMIAQIWVEIADEKIWRKYTFWYVLFLIVIVGLAIYFIVNS
ncbi:Uncharacterised protein [Moraxella lacunata]|uniref:Uncharacterized protein n=1 Tax=Moraxella lacunata TaxID=477 RepID=A0A378TT58_MORLA|nr:hypothetical protein [Moraxella lacunata]STZ64008.1 Uncharacterised protein [Moraxella lacunata]